MEYNRLTAGNQFFDAVFEASGISGPFYKSRLVWNGAGWDLTRRDGTVFVFGEAAPLQAIRDRFGNKVSIVRSGGQAGNISYVRSPNGRWLQFHYDSANRIDWIRDNLGRQVDYVYDSGGRLFQVHDPKDGVTEYTYNSSHQLVTAKTPRGHVFITNEYDPASGRVVRQTDATGGVWEFAYTTDSSGNVTQTEVTDPRGIIERVSFNADGDTITDVQAVGTPEERTWSFERQVGTSFLTKVTDPLGRHTRLTYDVFGNVKSVTRALGTADAVTTAFTYEPKYSRLTSVTDPLSHTTTIAYPSATRTVATDPLGHATTIDTNPAGQVTLIADALDNQTTITYELADPVAVTDGLGNTTSYFIDGGGRTAETIPASGVSVRGTYDALNSLTGVRDSLGNQTSLAYDEDGNLVLFTDPLSNATTYTYDPMDRLQTRTDALGRADTRDYDAAGSLSRFTDRRGKVTTLGYDPLGRRTFTGFGTVGSGGSATYESTISYGIDAADRLTEATDSVGGSIEMAYDALDRLTSQVTVQGGVSYTYDAADRRATMTVAGQPQLSYAYDDASRLIGINQGTASVLLGYDDADRRTSLTLPNGVTTAYGYDDASRLTSLTYANGVPLGDLAYGYDAAGLRSTVSGSFARVSLPSPVSSASYDAANQLTAWDGQAFTYDQAGNLTGDGSNTYSWNARGELAGISGVTAASFTYDAFGRRQAKTIAGDTTGFLYDGDNLVQELAGGSPSANLLSGGLDEVFTRTEGGLSTGFLADALGSTVALTDAAGSITNSYTYEPFGKATLTGAPSTNPYQFTGREADTAELNHYRARFYSPVTGRFISEDPLEFAGGSANLYAYVANSPFNLTDPFGTNPFGDLWSGIKSLASKAWSWIADHAWEIAVGVTFVAICVAASATCAGLVLRGISLLSPRAASWLMGARAAGLALVTPSSRALARALQAAGQVRPAGSAAHHMVAGSAAQAAAARAVLQRFGVGINDAVNGVFLPAAMHHSVHTSAYYQAGNEALSNATSRQQVIDILNSIGRALSSGGFP
ncbi:MAG: RHS repeat-associated core domain-containing protein [Actinomycetota bacterium]